MDMALHLCNLLFKTVTLIMGKTLKFHLWNIHKIPASVLLKTVKIIKNQERAKHSHNQEDKEKMMTNYKSVS